MSARADLLGRLGAMPQDEDGAVRLRATSTAPDPAPRAGTESPAD